MPKQLTIKKRDEIKEALKSMTKDEIASKLHCSKTTILKIEAGDYDNLEIQPKKERIVSNKRIVSKDTINDTNSELATTSELKKELRILIQCLGYGHNRFKDFPEYHIKNSSELSARIYEIIETI